MDAEFKTGLTVSGSLHGVLFLWLAIGGLFVSRDVDPIPVTDVSIISGDEFMAMQPSGPEATPDIDAPAPPVVEAAPDVAQPDTPDVAAASPALPPPAPSEPVPAPDVQEPPSPTPPTKLDAGPDAAPEIAPEAAPTPQAAPRVADQAAPAPEPDVTEAETEQAPSAPADAPDVIEEEQEETAPAEATTEIVTEAEEQPATAPDQSRRPTARPSRPPPPAVVAEEEPVEEPTPQTPDEDWDPVANAVAEALASEDAAPATSADATPAVQGPPLTSGETDAFRAQIGSCWSVGSISSEAQQTVVVVGFDMQPDGRLDGGSLRLVSSEGGNPGAAESAFQAARRAILRCEKGGYPLPGEKYEQWKQVEVTFDARSEQIR